MIFNPSKIKNGLFFVFFFFQAWIWYGTLCAHVITGKYEAQRIEAINWTLFEVESTNDWIQQNVNPITGESLPRHILSLIFFDVRHSCPEIWLISHRRIVLGCIIIEIKTHQNCLGWEVLYKGTHWRVQQEKSEPKLDFDERNLCECLSLLAREKNRERENLVDWFFSAKLCFTKLSDIASCLMSFRFIKSLMD